jgi:hypothetical protein
MFYEISLKYSASLGLVVEGKLGTLLIDVGVFSVPLLSGRD